MSPLWLAAALAGPITTSLLGTHTWRPPEGIDAITSHEGTVWVAAGSEVLAYDTDGRVTHRFSACGKHGNSLVSGGSLAVSPDGRHMAIACGDVRVVSLPDGAEKWSTSRQTGAPSLAFSPDAEQLVLTTETLTEQRYVRGWAFRVFDAATGTKVRDEPDTYRFVTRAGDGYVALSHDRSSIVGLGPGFEPRWTAPHDRERHQVHVLPDRVCLSGSRDIACHDLATGEPAGSFRPPRVPGKDWHHQLSSASWVGDAMWLRYAGLTFRWRPGGEPVQMEERPPEGRSFLAGERLFAYGQGPRLMGLQRDGRWQDADEEWAAPRDLVLSPDGRHIAFFDSYERLFVGPAEGPLRRVRGDWDPDPLALHPDGRQVVVDRSDDGGVVLLDTPTGQSRAITWGGRPLHYGRAQFGPDGTLWMTGSNRDTVGAIFGTVDLGTAALVPIATMGRPWRLDWVDPDGSRGIVSIAERAYPLDPRTGAIGEELRFDDLCRVTWFGDVLLSCEQHGDGIRFRGGPPATGSLALGPPGAPYVVTDLERPDRVLLRDPASHASIVELPHAMSMSTEHDVIAFSADGSTVALTLEDGRILVVRVR